MSNGRIKPLGKELYGILRGVSRSFYLTLRMLPCGVRHQISLAYLLARAADTIADTDVLPVESRLECLRKFRNKVLGKSNIDLRLDSFLKSAGKENAGARINSHKTVSVSITQDELRLLEKVDELVVILENYPSVDRQLIREVLKKISTGQELDLVRFGDASKSNIKTLQTDNDLDEYAYYVAGCVGEFWTAISKERVLGDAVNEYDLLFKNGVRFGKGLQYINILRDLPQDLQKGRCYIPIEGLKTLNLTPAELLNPDNEKRFRPLYNRYLNTAVGHLIAGRNYIMAIPWRFFRMRFVCALPLAIGVGTINKLKTEPVLDSDIVIKIDRYAVRKIIFKAVVLYPFPRLWERLFDIDSINI